MAFSDEKAVQLNYLQDEISAEWQAQQFALLLLLPDDVIIETRQIDLVGAAILTLVEEEQIDIRRQNFELYNRIYLDSYADAICGCGSTAVIKLGAGSLCQSCGNFI